MNMNFTGEELAKAHLLHLSTDEIMKYHETNKAKSRIRSNGFFAKLYRRTFPEKLFLVSLKNGDRILIMSKDERSACIDLVPFLTHASVSHSCKNPIYNSSCEKCKKVFEELAEMLNDASVTWIGWGQPEYNWVIRL